ncbi:MAG TPA: phenylalanine--tRNA ligase subunit alpha [Longimicrobiales bacterium]|nr:phenylalanine--tRNA ligase subunit alpha [Longimicrobiales bacterium]
METGLDVDGLLERAVEEVAAAASEEELEAARVRWLGRKDGRLTAVLRGLGTLPQERRGEVGAAANRAKAALVAAIERRQAALTAPGAEGPGVDLTLPGRRRWRGAYHPVTIVIDEICDIFRGLGFSRVRGPEAETVWHNFEALNTPLDHPAADEHDTMYLGPCTVLRSHTSPVQIRTMQAHDPPVRIVVPGMSYRRDPFDASHAPAFEQIEGLAVDEGITFVEFKWTLAEFGRRFFGADTETRFRPSYFPFTEPSAEVDVTCMICDAAGCSACKGTGWVEIMGAGMVDPAVFEQVGYDPERYTGFAFGMGPARIAMLRYGIPDIRMFYDSDARFLEQFAR